MTAKNAKRMLALYALYFPGPEEFIINLQLNVDYPTRGLP